MRAELQCYDRWGREFRDPGRKRGIGDAYCLGVYHSTHRAAGGFLREIAPRHPAAAERLLQAAASFAAEADTLDLCLPLLWWGAPDGPDADRNAKAADLLTQARDHYTRGMAALEAGSREVG